jgi:hypothetical protein
MATYYIVTNNKIGFFKINYEGWAEITNDINNATKLKINEYENG